MQILNSFQNVMGKIFRTFVIAWIPIEMAALFFLLSMEICRTAKTGLKYDPKTFMHCTNHSSVMLTYCSPKIKNELLMNLP